MDIKAHAANLVTAVASATAASAGQADLCGQIEMTLQAACGELGIAWSAYQLARARPGAGRARIRCTDFAHGAVIIGYQPPNGFKGGGAAAAVAQACARAEQLAEMLSAEEGRPLTQYVPIAWDGATIRFGRPDGARLGWGPLTTFDAAAAQRLLRHLRDDGIPLVHPRLLSQLAGPESAVGAGLLPKLYAAVQASGGRSAPATRTKLRYSAWCGLFGQVVGTQVQSERMRRLLAEQGAAHRQRYQDDPAAYLYSLNTYIALVAKIAAAMALPNHAREISNRTVPIRQRIRVLESGRLFADAGVLNMLNGDFFAWYVDDLAWPEYCADVAEVINTLSAINFDVSRKSPGSTRDLFKGLCMTFVPRALRHALGEYYTPDWLAAHVLDQINWTPDADLLDPTAGSGTFVLEALRRRIAAAPDAPARDLLSGLWGIDLNPLAVLAAKASLVVCLAGKLQPQAPLRLPVFLADAINTVTSPADGVYEHRLQTDRGVRTFRLPAALVKHADFDRVLSSARELIDANATEGDIGEALSRRFDFAYLDADGLADLRGTLAGLCELRGYGWDGIWCAILADRFAAGAIDPVSYVAGNPPWVKWSQLPPEYAEFIKERCSGLGVFSVDRWVGGIESDISTVVTYAAISRYLADGGVLAFLITGAVFANESGRGFRRWHVRSDDVDMRVEVVEDFSAIAPFEGVSNHATMLVLTRGAATSYPVTYRIWSARQEPARPRRAPRSFPDGATFRSNSAYADLAATPVPGSDAGPWLKGTAEQHEVWSHLFGPQDRPAFRARKGITTDANGIFFVEATAGPEAGTVTIVNNPPLGRRREVPRVRHVIESEHVFPLLRGEGVSAFRAAPDPRYRVLVPQRGMHGDPDLPRHAPRTHQYLARFEGVLAGRSSFKRFQARQGAPYWSLWSTGSYTFSAYKVAWRELGGGRFAAAYLSTFADPVLGEKPVLPDHKLYFVPCASEEEAAYLTGLLNAPSIAEAVSAYAAQLSLGASVVEYLLLPAFDPNDSRHRDVAGLCVKVTHAEGAATGRDLADLDELAAAISRFPPRSPCRLPARRG